MTKKLFVVLVVISAMLISFSLLMAAKKAPLRMAPEKYTKQSIDQQSATLLPAGSLTQPLDASALFPPLSTAAAKPDKIEGYSPPGGSLEGIPKQEGGETCATATAIGSLPFNATGYTCDNVHDYDEVCPYTGSTAPDVVYSYTPGANETINIDLWGSGYDTKVYVYEDDCVPPYYACNDDFYSNYVSAIFGLDIYAGHTYYIVVDGYGTVCGDYIILVEEYVPCDVVCPTEGIPEDEPICTDDWEDIWNGGCNSAGPPYPFEDVNCGDIICGTSGTYDYYGDNYRDTDWFRVVLTDATTLSWKVVAEFPLLIFIIDAGSEDCVDYAILGSATAVECDTAFLSFDVPAGVYWLWVGPSVFSGIDCGVEYVGIVDCEGAVGCCQLTGSCDMLTEADCNTAGGTWYALPYECIDDVCQIPVDTLCHLQWDDGSATWYASGYVVGDQQANYFDPAAMCPGCGPDVYPFLISQVSGMFYDYNANGYVDVIVHIYAADPDSCAGPGAEIYSFPYTVTTFYSSEQIIPLPEVLCVEEDFFVAFEIVAPATSPACVLWTNEPGMADCISWLWYNTYSPPWNDLKYFWSGVGYHMIRADGVCNSGACAGGVECYMFQGTGTPASYWSGWGLDDGVAKYYDPEEYCIPPVYPVKLSDVDVALYDYNSYGTVNVEVAIYIECSEPCDGPGTEIYRSDPITVTTFYPSLATITLPDLICVYEPFFVGIHYPDGISGDPSVMFDNGPPPDTCHAWMWYESAGYSPPWIEWSDFWSPPPPGCPMIYVTGYTEDPACDPPPCDTTLVRLDGGISAAYYWTIPDAYGDDFFNERFQMPAAHGGRLEKFDFAFYQAEAVGTPDPDFYVWLSDGVLPLDNNPPYQAIADFHITFPEIVWYPGWTTVQTYSHGIEFDPSEQFHIGYSHADHVNDVLPCLSDDGSNVSDRSSEWWGVWGTMLDDWGVGVDFLIHAYICPFAPEGSTFTMQCAPSVALGTPGDVDVDLYDVTIGAVLGYNLNVDLSLLSPPAGISITFVPNGQPAPYDADALVTIDLGVAYDDYPLTFQAVGTDGQTKTCDVTLRVQPPYDEGIVNFFHGFQRTSTFGAVGNDVKDNFVWYGSNYLFDGSIISAVDATVVGGEQKDHFALDVYNCEHVGFIPTQHLVITDEPWCPGSAYEEAYGEIAYSNFYTHEDVISCEYDSLFVIGLRWVDCTEFSIKIKIYYNPTTTDIPELWIGLFEDWDIGNAYDNWVEMDPDHNLVWQYDPVDPSIVFGILKVPFYNEPMHSIVGVNNAYYVWPNAGFCDDAGGFHGLDSLFYLMTRAGYYPPYDINSDSNDMSLLMVPPPFSLNPGEKHIEIWIDFGRNLMDGLTWEQWYHKILRYAGFYRGDVNASDTLELPALDVSDLVYLVNYLWKGGPAPQPFADQGDVDGQPNPKDIVCPKNNVNVGDVVYLINYVWKNGPPPVDYVRYIEQYWSRPSLFEEPGW